MQLRNQSIEDVQANMLGVSNRLVLKLYTDYYGFGSVLKGCRRVPFGPPNGRIHLIAIVKYGVATQPELLLQNQFRLS